MYYKVGLIYQNKSFLKVFFEKDFELL